MSHRSSLLENNSNGNPFEILQTIPIQTEPIADDDNIFAVPKPREASKSKRNRTRNPSVKKRSSAPSQSLANGITEATQKLKQQQQPFPTQVRTAPVSAQPRPQAQSAVAAPVSSTDDLLGIFSMAPTSAAPARPALAATSYSQPVPNANPFEYFNPLAGAEANNLFAGASPSSKPGSLAGSKRPSTASEVSSVDHAELFDPNMWISSSSSDFFASEAEKQDKVQQQQSTVGLTMAGFSEDKDDDEDDDSSTEGSEEPAERPRRKTIDRENEEDTKDKEAEVPEPPTNCLIEMHRGTALLKYPRRHGFPHFKHVQLSKDNRRIQWFSKRKSLEETCIRISDVREIRTGQKTETFQKFHQEVLEKASFSIVFGDNYRTFDVVAKSTDECNMWVLSLRKLKGMQETGTDLSTLSYMDVGIAFKDRNRPKSRDGSGNFVRANNSRQLKMDPVAMKQIERDMDQLRRNYQNITNKTKKPNITRSHEFDNIQQVLSELEERIEELTHEVNNTRDTDMSKRDVWRANVDLTAIGEKVDVLTKVFDVNGNPKR